ncbi:MULTISPECIES: ABC transporter permease [Eubacteriales]|jgi:peptide/nickel transport system permease protein|uniref:ABC transporter permease n=1 Tax=Eubacteriales TaxID=186802 RepID=UPI00216CC5BE|nr:MULTISPECIES: ABC transporter permease [Eubacteriales]MCI9113428.1 ABC transporter permease [Oscillibacter sp.]
MYKNFVRFALRKLGIMILTVFLISFFVFFIITLPPGDFLTNYIGRMSAAGETVSPELVAQLKSNYGLDQPFIVQYWKWISNIIFHGDFGYSFALSMPVSAVIKAYIVPTMVLSLVTMIFTYLIAIPIGIYSAVHQYSVGDYLFTSVGFIGMAVPNFLMGIILMFISFKLTGNTMLGLYSPGMENAPWSMAKMIDLLQHSIIPVLVIGLMNTCSLMRTMRGQMLDELGKNYVMTARAKGMKARAIRYKYCVRAAINPIVSSIGWSLVNIFTGTTIVAIVLNLPSMGRVMHNALLDQDMYLAGSWLFLMAIMTVVGTFISDLLLAWLDPRARAEYLKG